MNIRALLRQPLLTISFHSREARWTLGARGQVRASGRIALPADALSDGVIIDPGRIGQLLRDAPEFPGSGRMQVALALPAQRTIFRTLSLPPLQGKEFAQLAAREIRREMPMVTDNAHISWKRVDDRDGKATVFVVAAARDVLDSHVAALKAAGLQPQSADLRVIAGARAIGAGDAVIASVEDDELEIGIFRDGLPSIVRHIDLVEGTAPEAWAQQVAEELARTLKFYRDTHRDDARAADMPISFIGDAARRALLSAEVAAQTGRTLEMPALRLVISPEQESVGFAANLGLNLKDIAA